jgi:hypothetical protein
MESVLLTSANPLDRAGEAAGIGRGDPHDERQGRPG